MANRKDIQKLKPTDLIRRLAEDQARFWDLTRAQVEAITPHLLGLNAQAVSVLRPIQPNADLLLTMKDQLRGIERIAVEVKTLQASLGANYIREIQRTMETLNAQRAVLIGNAFTEQAKTLAASLSAVQIADAARVTEWARAFEAERAAFASALALRIRALPWQELARVEEPNLETIPPDEPPSDIIATPYRERIVRVDNLPFRALRAVIADPRHLRTLTPRQFEEFTAEILDTLGFSDVKLTPATRDGGRDVIASRTIKGIPLTFYFECKKYAEGNKVQLETLRALLGVVAHEATTANIGVLVTTSTFTAGSSALILGEARLDGKDYQGILGWVEEAERRIQEGDDNAG
ncbi:restriction endonuclease [Candidatus Bipolaricaulota bacterium]|nr:restriction endonuclease [Candidatus Bipolaricaulota bacterium]